MPLTRILEKGKRKRIKMGMAASQVRYLALQNRNNTIGLNLMTLANRRTALERDMSRVAKLYNEAMNEKMLKLSTDSGVSYKDLSYDTLMKSSAGISKLPFIITDANGRAVLDDTELIVNGQKTGYSYKDLAQIISQYDGGVESTPNVLYTAIYPRKSDTSGDANKTYDSSFLAYKYTGDVGVFNILRVDLFQKLGLINVEQFNNSENILLAYRVDGNSDWVRTGAMSINDFKDSIDIKDNYEYLDGSGKIRNGSEIKNTSGAANSKELIEYLCSVSNTPTMKYFDAIFKYIAENGWVYDETINNPNRPSQSRSALQEKLRNNIYYLTEASAEDLNAESKIGYDTKIALNTNIIYDTYDTASQNAALATYEAEKSDIQSKEKQIDLRMSRLEMEQSAIKTELDSIKSIINDNVNTTFKIFG